MLETLITSLLLALVSAITFLAYKHPEAYQKIYHPLTIALATINVMIMVWNVAVQTTGLTVVRQKINPDDIPKVDEAMRSISILPGSWQVPLIWILTWGFLYFLKQLPAILAKQDDDTGPEDQSPKNGQDDIKKK